jgi:hypothetical protein
MRLRTSPWYNLTARCRLAACLLHVVMLVLAAEVSGTLHAALDIAVEAGVVDHPDDDCERDGHECPPGCLSCHCTHAASAMAGPACDWVDAQLTPRTYSEKPSTFDGRVPSGPERGRIDRPPRPLRS